ncbi:putative bifunctional diguanylate cyclase/phosphodiesterase [Alicyclobacillus fodiniaquatilis]|uniref:Bifunctional diguanylate cyclase/phosphodiesterase n=1 Tax=Alicyclobacillus fodiniaquatilis TaxID=1661150 RepID=A0ABW4JIU2_9BACL
MLFLLMFYIGLVPILFALSIIPLFGRSQLTFALVSFLILTAIWQWDVADLYSYSVLQRPTALILFRLFRFGTIFLIPSLFFVASTATNLVPKGNRPNWWKFCYNKVVIGGIALWSAFVYTIGWTRAGITLLRTVNFGRYILLFPIYGPLAWTFYAQVVAFGIFTVLCFRVTRRIQDGITRKFLIQFLISAALMFSVGLFNIYPSIFVFSSGLTCIIFSSTIFIAYSRFVSERYRSANQSLQEQSEFLHKVIDVSPNYLSVMNSKGLFTIVNRAFARFYGLPSDSIIGRSLEEVEELRNRGIRSHMEQGTTVEQTPETVPTVQRNLINAVGQTRTVTTVEIPVNFHHASQTLRVSTDITDRIEYEERIKRHAYYDSLTGLPNRMSFNQSIDNIIHSFDKYSTNFAVLFLDMDRFKNVNDTLGHNIGDEVLCEIGKRLSKVIDNLHGVVARWGGDEFTLIIPFEDTDRLLMAVQGLISDLEQVISLTNIELFITPSIGISLYPEHGNNVNSLLQAADIAMYRAKKYGIKYQIYSHLMTKATLGLELEMDLRRALEGDEFELYFQPKIDTNSRRIVGTEALIRWLHPRKGVISPNDFIPIAEETGMILKIGDWVIQQACRQNKIWMDEGLLNVPISVNISPLQLWFGDIVKSIKEVLTQTGLPPDYLELEVTEGIAVQNEIQAIERLGALRELGIRIAVDDFGKGYSSLNSLRLFPADSLKVDKAFIDQLSIPNSEKNNQITKHIISLAHAIGLRVIAEGVESEEQFHCLKAFNCDEVQGYLFSRPIPEKEFRKLVPLQAT